MLSRSRFLQYAISGLEVGIYGGLAMLAWFMLYSLFKGDSVWRTPDLLASTFYGDVAFEDRSIGVTLSGVALHLVTSGILGAVFGLLAREMTNYVRVSLLGLMLGLGWYYLSYMVLWKRFNPLIPLYASYRPMLIAHLLFGAVLGRYSHCLASLRRNFYPKPEESPTLDC